MRKTTPPPSLTVSDRCGFTLVEVIIAILILGLTIVAIGSVMHTAIRSWNLGNDMGEIVQTARITKDVLQRDLHNMVYKRQRDYNADFLAGLFNAAQMYGPDYDKEGRLNLDDRFDFSKLKPPIDLSFRIEDSGSQDRLTFVQSYQSRFAGDPSTWGMRRVTYYIKSGTLVREESDPFGYRPGQLDESFFNAGAATVALAERFMKEDGFHYMLPDNAQDKPLPADQRLLPEELENAEPLCEGIEQFNVTCGYFKDGQWHETPNWDSSARHYRKPPILEPIDDKNKSNADGLPQLPTGLQPVPDENGVMSLIKDRGLPDDLPGYLIIQIGTRGPRNVGKSHMFTFFQALPIGQEEDSITLSQEQKDKGDIPPVDLTPPYFATK